MSGNHANIFEAYHLASFVCRDGHNISTEDALERLKLIERSAALTPIHLLIVVGSNEIKILSRENSEEIEQFPLKTVCSMSFRMTGDSQDGCYNNLIFLVTPSGDYAVSNKTEMHIFSCIYTPANQVIALMKKAQLGQWKPSVEPSSPISNLQITNNHNLQPFRGSNYPIRSHESSMDRIEIQYFLLNRCFDDIDRFVAQIQLAITALRELHERQNQRKKKVKHSGDGLLTIRARLPSIDQFVDCLKKFKLSFNLLSLLQTRLEDPSASELVHNMFRLLSIVVSTCRRNFSSSPQKVSNSPKAKSHIISDIPSRVVSPLLSKDAVILLRYSLTPQEDALWNSLGPAWQTAREEWTDHVPSYIPTFNDGYSPDPSQFELALSSDDRRKNLSHQSSFHSSSHTLVELTSSLNQGVRRAHSSKQSDELTHELKTKLKQMPVQAEPHYVVPQASTSGKAAQMSPPIQNNNVRKPPKVSNINMDSSPATVRDWLTYKGFSYNVLEALREKTGSDLFDMTRVQMDALIGPEDASRLESVLKVQKNIAGYKTMSGRELQGILQRRKLKAESTTESENSDDQNEIELIDQLFKSIYSHPHE